MKRLQGFLLVALSSSLFLYGCQKQEDIAPVPSANVQEQSDHEPVSTKEAIPSEEETTEALTDTPPSDGMVRSRLTGEWVSESLSSTRPVAVMIPNSKTASQYGLSEASVLYECNIEGSMTRLMAIFEDCESLEKVGNIRSCRDYFLYWAFEWDAICIHYGGPFYMDDLLAREDTQNINCIDYSKASYRDEAKNATDNAFTDGKLIANAIDHYGYPLSYREGYTDDSHYQFASFSSPNTLEQYENAISAKKVDLSSAYPVTNCYFLYDTKTGLYDRYQHISGDVDGPHMDSANNQQLSFKNLLIQNTYYEVRDQKGYLAFQAHDTTRDGWFFTNGKGIHVNWKKTADYSATRYYDDNGNEIELNPGKTMICILEDQDTFYVDDSAIQSIS